MVINQDIVLKISRFNHCTPRISILVILFLQLFPILWGWLIVSLIALSRTIFFDFISEDKTEVALSHHYLMSLHALLLFFLLIDLALVVFVFNDNTLSKSQSLPRAREVCIAIIIITYSVKLLDQTHLVTSMGVWLVRRWTDGKLSWRRRNLLVLPWFFIWHFHGHCKDVIVCPKVRL